ncbi:vWA domain-containing protein [Breznakiella homolactica]|uniref:VWA domain-containing protein n=1 Tax=Breznakiella homolactica TaxID=2798577 RepID=A0A7T7XMD2_9SPIR|nr:VWA domain-containing protein [Breznakiella homolactica]QQO08951.1 VWA domain-containing protein [Breznakiella homolactica]
MSFDKPAVLYLLFLLIPLGIAAASVTRRRIKVLITFLAPQGGEDRQDSMRRFSAVYSLSAVFFLVFLASITVAMAGPRWGSRLVPELRKGVDVVFAVDVSRSMNARDVAPSRLGRAVSIAGTIVRDSGGIRFALALGRGSGVLAVPLTDDSEALLTYFESLSGSSLTGTGTNLEHLLDAAAGAFQDSFSTRRQLILFSDGEALSGALSAAAERLRDADISLIAVALGTEAGSPVPMGPGSDRFLLQDGGSPVVSSLRPDSLRHAADRTGGFYIDGSRNDAASLLGEYINSLAVDSAVGGYRRETKAQWHIFIVAGLAALALSVLIGRALGGRQ